MQVSSSGNHFFNSSITSGVGKCDYFEVFEGGAVDDESHQRALLVPSLHAGGSRIEVEQPQRLVVFHLEDMRVPGDEELWRVGEEGGAG